MTRPSEISTRQIAGAPLSCFAVTSLLFFAFALACGPEVYASQKQLEQYEAETPKTILELQQFRESQSIQIRSRRGREGTATLANLNPAINAWYLLKLAWKGSSVETAYHLENAAPHTRRFLLDENCPSDLIIVEGINRSSCDLFGADALDQAKASQVVYYPLCSGRLYLRNPAIGHRTTLEATTEFLRDHIWGGEKIIALGHIVMGDAHHETGRIDTGAQGAAATRPVEKLADLPLPALIDSRSTDRLLTSSNLGISLEGQKNLASPQEHGIRPPETPEFT